MNIYENQIIFLSKLNVLLKKSKRQNLSNKSNSIFYLSSYTKSFGYLIINYFLKKSKVRENFDIILKDLFSTSSRKFKSIVSNKIPLFKKIIVSWAYKKDFKNNGSYFDNYLNINSRNEKDTLWYVIYLDKDLPIKIDSNICIFQVINEGFNFFNVVRILLQNFSYIFKNINYFLSSISTHNNLAINIGKDFKKFLSKDLKKILINYEAQPFQNEIIRISKKFNNKISITGNIHAPLMAMPSHLIFKDFSPDKIIVNGTDIKSFFINYLKWPLKRVLVKKSFRILNVKKKMANYVFLPNNINSTKLIMDSFDFLINKKFYNFSNFKIKIHPGQLKSEVHIYLALILKKLLRSSKKNSSMNKNKNLSVFIGATGSLIEALERKNNTIHICEDVTLEHYSNEFYSNIISKKLRKNIFNYKLKKNGCLLLFGKKRNDISEYFC